MLLLAGRRCNIHLVMVMVAGAADGGVVDRKNKKNKRGEVMNQTNDTFWRQSLPPTQNSNCKFKICLVLF